VAQWLHLQTKCTFGGCIVRVGQDIRPSLHPNFTYFVNCLFGPRTKPRSLVLRAFQAGPFSQVMSPALRYVCDLKGFLQVSVCRENAKDVLKAAFGLCLLLRCASSGTGHPGTQLVQAVLRSSCASRCVRASASRWLDLSRPESSPMPSHRRFSSRLCLKEEKKCSKYTGQPGKHGLTIDY